MIVVHSFHRTMATTNPSDAELLKAIKRGSFRNSYLIYNRKSLDEAESQKNSILYQRNENTRFATREGLSIAEVTLTGFAKSGIISEKHSGFIESGDLVISPTGMVQYKIERPKFQQLLQYLNHGYFRGVICLCWDRISRNDGDNTVIRKLVRSGVDVRFAYANYDQSSSGALHMDIDGVFAHHHSRVTSEKVRLATRAKREEGKCTYRAPIGYLNEGNIDHKPFDPERAPIIRELFQLYATGDWSIPDLCRHAAAQGLTTVPVRSPRSLAEMLDDDEDDELAMRPKASRPLAINHLHKILRNPFYAGYIIGHDGMYLPSTSHEALIDQDTFDAVQDTLRCKRVSVHYTTKLDHPFRGCVRCAQCNRVYTPYKKKGIVYYNARCAPECGNTLKNCNFDYVSGLFRSVIERMCPSADEMEQLETNSETALLVLIDDQQKQAARRDRKAAKLREDLSYLTANQLALLKAGAYTPESLTAERFKLNAELAELHEETEITEDAIGRTVEDVLRLSELLKVALNLFDLAKPAERERIAKTLVSELRIDQNTFEYSAQTIFAPLFERKISVCDPMERLSELVKMGLQDMVALLKDALQEPKDR